MAENVERLGRNGLFLITKYPGVPSTHLINVRRKKTNWKVNRTTFKFCLHDYQLLLYLEKL